MRVLMALGMVMAVAGAAQARQEPRVDLGGAAGYARALHGDLGFGDVAVSASARVRVARHVAFEGQFGYWEHTERDTFRIASATFQSTKRHQFPSVAANILAIADSRARVAPYGGAGVGVFYHFSEYEVTGPHQFPYDRSDWRITLGVQLTGGADVRLGSRLKAYSEFRFNVESLQDPGSSTYRVLGGVRVPIG